MKRLYILILIGVLSLTACNCGHSKDENPEHPFKYNLGEVVSFKIDDSPCIVIDRWDDGDHNKYEVKYRDDDNAYNRTYAYEYELVEDGF